MNERPRVGVRAILIRRAADDVSKFSDAVAVAPVAAERPEIGEAAAVAIGAITGAGAAVAGHLTERIDGISETVRAAAECSPAVGSGIDPAVGGGSERQAAPPGVLGPPRDLAAVVDRV